MDQRVLRPSIIEALKALWVALPVRASNDGESGDPRERQMAILDAYCFALSEFSSESIWNTVNNLRAGKIEEASKDFCPKSPKLAEYVRAEQRRLDAVRRPPAITYQPATHAFKDHRITQRAETERLAEAGFHCVATNIGLDEFVSRGKRKTLPPGTIFFWAISEAWTRSA